MGIYDGSHEKSITSSNVSVEGTHGWDMQGHKIVNINNPDSTDDQKLTVTIKFGSTNYLFKKVPPTAVSFSNMMDNVSINMNNNRLFGLPVALIDSDAIILSYLKSHVYNQLSETLLWEYYTKYGTALYKIDRGSSSEVVMDSTTRKVSKLYDQSLFENFIVYKLNSNNGMYWLRNGLFAHDNGGYDKFIAFSPAGELAVAGTTNEHVICGPSSVNGKAPLGPYQNKANAAELNKWICLSIHWNAPAGANKSNGWCNGIKLGDFTAGTSTGSNQMTFRDLNPGGIAGLMGPLLFWII